MHGVAVALAVLLMGGCRQDMHDQPKYRPLRSSRFFSDGRTSRPPVAGTVARGQLYEDVGLHTGKAGGEYLTEPPLPVTMPLLQRGRERYDIYCAVCHDRAGNGTGMVVRRGFRPARTFHCERLRRMPDGYIFEVITNGFGAMPGYAGMIPARDRWAIVGYVRALQLSQAATLAEVPAAEREKLAQAGGREGVVGKPHRPRALGDCDAAGYR